MASDVSKFSALWTALVRDMHPDQEVAQKFRNLFIQQFSQPHRLYHNLRWAVDVSRDARSVALYKNVSPDAIILTLWFSKLVLPAESNFYKDTCEVSLQGFFEDALGDQVMSKVAHEALVDVLMDIPTSDFSKMVTTAERMYMIKPSLVYDDRVAKMVQEAKKMGNYAYYLEDRIDCLNWLLTVPERGLPSTPYNKEPHRSLMLENIRRELMVLTRLSAAERSETPPKFAEDYDKDDLIMSEIYLG